MTKRTILVALMAVGCAPADGGGWAGEPAPAEVGTPIGPAVTVVIGPDGGDLASDDGAFVLSVPAGALDRDTELTLTPITNTAWGGFGDGYRLSPELAFAVPAEISVGYTEGDLVGTSEELLGVAAQDPDGYWLAFPDGAVDPDGHTITVQVDEVGSPTPGLRGAPRAVDFAAHWRLRLDPAEADVKRGGRKALALVACTTGETLGWPFSDDSGVELGAPAPYTSSGPVAWSVSGVPTGTVTGTSSGATYLAPKGRIVSGAKNLVEASFKVGTRNFAPRATIHLQDDVDSWAGTSTFRGPGYTFTATVVWTLDSTHDDARWFVPSGTVDVTMDQGSSCTTSPLSADLAETDGLLVVDYATDPPTYSGQGVSVWATTITCTQGPPVAAMFAAPWFGDAEDVLATLGKVQVDGESEVIAGTNAIGNATVSWRFEKQ